MKNLYLISFLFLLINCSPSKSEKIFYKESFEDSVINKEEKISFIKLQFPFDLTSGIPFYKSSEYGYTVEGFDVDLENRLFFMGGTANQTVIACFRNKTELWRKQYSQIGASQVHSFGSYLYVFDKNLGANNLIIIEPSNGKVIKVYEKITDNRVNDYLFIDSILHLNVFDLNERVSLKSKLFSIAFMLDGDSIEPNVNSNKIEPNSKESRSHEFLGYWKQNKVYWDLGGNFSEYQIISIENDDHGLKEDIKIYDSSFHESMYGEEGNPSEHRKLVENKLYFLGEKNDSASVWILNLEIAFINN